MTRGQAEVALPYLEREFNTLERCHIVRCADLDRQRLEVRRLRLRWWFGVGVVVSGLTWAGLVAAGFGSALGVTVAACVGLLAWMVGALAMPDRVDCESLLALEEDIELVRLSLEHTRRMAGGQVTPEA
ncbi:MAG: hypothetical protein ACC742_05480 [Thermoanaerobaculales bacterium]